MILCAGQIFEKHSDKQSVTNNIDLLAKINNNEKYGDFRLLKDSMLYCYAIFIKIDPL